VTDKIAESKFNDPYNKIFKLGEYQDKMKGVVLKRADYRDVIAEYDSADTFFYLDPPYEKSNKQQYKHFGFDYEEFRDIVSKIKGKFLISINDSPYIRELFRGFKIESIILPASGSHQTKPRRELFISG
jgi:DNA adenine methylase